MKDLETLLQFIEERCPVQGYTAAALLCTSVRRMKMEKELAIPLVHRTSSIVAADAGKPANELDEKEWGDLYSWLCERLKARYPDEHARLFQPEPPQDR